ncbi:MAG TPA: glycoside hydrolase family 5 protein [bacterium]|nr:glycoside hydrolase family 5 protein [bacterium]
MSLRLIRPILALGLAALSLSCGPQTTAVVPSNAAPAVDASGLEDLSSMEVVGKMGLGWNLGNTLEACGSWIKGPDIRSFETAWGNPETTKEMIDKIKADGFGSVRIPVAWSNMIEGDYTINWRLQERVKQVVDWVLADGMIAVVNIHWDGGWWSKFPVDYDNSMKRYTRMWSQIAGYFKDEPGSLIFESLNEEGSFNDVWNRWGGGTPEQKAKAYGILNNINQAFVDLVRKSGGLNAKRHLLIAGYATDIDLTVDPAFGMPKDPAGHCIVSVHYYTPFTFAGLEHDETWGKARPTWGTDADKAELEANMNKLKPRFLDQGIPVIVGEYGATLKTKEPDSVRLYILSVAEKVYGMGMCPMLWDPGTHFDRRSLEFNDPDLLKGFQKIESGKRN